MSREAPQKRVSSERDLQEMVSDNDVRAASRKLQEAMEQNTHRSLRDFFPDNHIRAYEECTPNEEAAKEDFQRIKSALERLGVNIKKERVLEVGSGMGELLRVLQENKVNAVGTDFNPRQYRSAKPMVGIIHAPLGALKPETIGQFGVILAKNLFDRDRYGFQVYKDMLQDIDALLSSGSVFVKLGTGRFDEGDIPTDWERVVGDNTGVGLSIYKKK